MHAVECMRVREYMCANERIRVRGKYMRVCECVRVCECQSVVESMREG